MKRRKSVNAPTLSPGIVLLTGFMVCAIIVSTVGIMAVRADNFTDIFYTNSFRGAFEWFKKLDWVGMIVQAVISCFSLFGVALLVIRIMTSMLYLSAKGMWEEVHDLKSSGGESELYDFGMLNMAKSWAKGKAGTGLDAIIGAVLMLLPDVKKYSDFGEKNKGGDFGDDITISQYMLKILLPTVATVFFFAMGFNGTLFQALAVTVDFLGSIADTAISVNYSGFVDDFVNSETGYKFAYKAMGTEQGNFKNGLAKDLYGRAVKGYGDLNANQLAIIGKAVEAKIEENVTTDENSEVQKSNAITDRVKNGLLDGEQPSLQDNYWSYIGYDIIVNSTEEAPGAWNISEEELVGEAGLYSIGGGDVAGKYFHIYFKQTRDFSGTYINVDGQGNT